MGVMCNNHVGVKLACNRISVHLVYVDLLFLKSLSFGKWDLCVH